MCFFVRFWIAPPSVQKCQKEQEPKLNAEVPIPSLEKAQKLSYSNQDKSSIQ